MWYPDLLFCREAVYPLIRTRMATQEPAPYYDDEKQGENHLSAIFDLMQRSDYRGVLGKAAYLFCSTIDGHHFSNGNKRLAVVLVVFFLLANHYQIRAPRMELVQRWLRKAFPHLQWEQVSAFSHPHEYFFYHLALVIADRHQKGNITFTEEQRLIVDLLKVMVRR